MRRSMIACLVVLAVGLAGAAGLGPEAPQDKSTFGGKKDVAFAKKLWKAAEGYPKWKLTSDVSKGGSPHGKWVRLFSTWVTVDGRSYPIIVKENYGGRGVTQEKARQDRQKWLQAVTIMLQREAGYDRDNQNWFWVKYDPKGEIMSNAKGVKLAGRVAKGTTKGCIGCHSQAGGKDYLFSND